MYNIELYSRFHSAFGFVARNAIDKAETLWLKQNMSLYVRGDSTFADMTIKRANGTEYVFKNPEPPKRSNNIVSAISQSFSSASVFGNIEGVIAPPPMVSFSQEKNITRTIIDNSDFEVIENFGLKSWNISIEGIVVDMDNKWYPSEMVRKVRELFQINETLSVIGQLFEDLNIRQIYFTKVDIEPLAEYNDTVKFKIDAYSIRPAEFFLLT
jgi:hypothetical protein